MTTDIAPERSQTDSAQPQTTTLGSDDGKEARDLLAEVEAKPDAKPETAETGSTALGTEPPAPTIDDTEDPLEASISAKAEAIAEKKLADQKAADEAKAKEDAKKQREKQRKEGVKAQFDGWAPQMRNILERVARGELDLTQGMPHAPNTTLLDGILNTFAQHGSSAQEVERMAAREMLGEVVGGWLSEDSREAFLKEHGESDDPSAFLSAAHEAVVKEARKGYYSEAQLKDAKGDGMVTYRKWLTDKGHPERLDALLSQVRGPSGSRGTVAGSGGSLNYRTKQDARNLHAQKQISNAEMRRVENDRNIPEA